MRYVANATAGATRVQRFPNPAAAALTAGFLALLYVAPLAAQSTKSLLDLLTNPQAGDMPPLVLASSDGVMLAGRPIIQAVPRLTLAPHHGDRLAAIAPQRLAAASPDITALPHIDPMRPLTPVVALHLTPHFPNPETAPDRALLEGILGKPLPPGFEKIEPAPEGLLVMTAVGLLAFAGAEPAAPRPLAPEVAWLPVALPALQALTAPDTLRLRDATFEVPPPPLKPQTLAAVVPELTALPRVPPAQGLTPHVLDPANPEDKAVLNTIPGLPAQPETTAPAVVLAVVPAVVPPEVAPLTGPALDMALQVELLRLNCLAGPADGSFGAGSKGALDLFFAASGQTRATQDRSQAVLDQLLATPGTVCDAAYAPVKKTPVATPPVVKPPVVKTPPVKTPPVKTPVTPVVPKKPPPPAKGHIDCNKDPVSCGAGSGG